MSQKIIFLMAIFLVSCVDQKKSEINLLSEEVMKVHDEVMPKMTELHNAKKMLKLQLGKVDSSLVFDAIKRIDDADEAMMVWMDEYHTQIDSLSIVDQKIYLNLELDKIDKVKEMMLTSLEHANKILNHDVKK